jgi:hypothetical protein
LKTLQMIGCGGGGFFVIGTDWHRLGERSLGVRWDTSARARYSLLSLGVLPVFGFTKCTIPHARQVMPTKKSPAPSDWSSPGAKPCTRKPVLGHLAPISEGSHRVLADMMSLPPECVGRARKAD